jgi:hypothetical protein
MWSAPTTTTTEEVNLDNSRSVAAAMMDNDHATSTSDTYFKGFGSWNASQLIAMTLTLLACFLSAFVVSSVYAGNQKASKLASQHNGLVTRSKSSKGSKGPRSKSKSSKSKGGLCDDPSQGSFPDPTMLLDTVFVAKEQRLMYFANLI